MRTVPSFLLAAALLASPRASASGYALVVTNNRSLDPGRPDLQYADDDGAKYAELFSEVYGEGHVVLLTRFDDETRALYPRWAQVARPPTLAALDQAVAELRGQLEADERAGAAPELHVVFAGHGDIDHGMGYVELLDGRLTARDLESRLIQKLPARRVHLILDSCNSYFMLNPRKPGGQRWATSADDSQSLLRRYPHVGAVISTSAEAVTYEWSDLQSGIFSYEVRSGLRGAADADHDGRISYPELAAFIQVANRPVVNDLYRPKVFSAPPLSDSAAAILTLDAAARTLTIPAAGQRRLTLRDENGVRVMDLNKEDRTPLTLALPRGAEEIGVYEQVDAPDKARPTVTYRSIEGPGPVALDDVSAGPSPIAVRGSEAPVFRGLFHDPFGKEAYAHLQADLARAPPALPFGVSVRDAERLRAHLESGGDAAPGQRATGVLIASGGVLAGGAVWGFSGQLDSPDARLWGRVLGTAGAGSAVVAGVITAVVPSGQERLAIDYAAQDLSSEEARTRAVLGTEARIDAQVQGDRQARAVGSWLLIGAGAVQAAAGTYVLATAPQGSDARPAGVAYLGAGAFGILEGLVLMQLSRTPLERAWELYLDDSQAPSKVELGAGPGLVGISVNGRFP
ncbi:MAG TPA: hypothetical protein VND93_17555 [Myxococcales bacterium]|nr:hypothetical protein [Myxococcales bacterium]